MRYLALTFVLALGCGGSPATSTPKAATCADAAANLEAKLSASADENERASAAAGSKAVAERCPADGWSAEIIACYATGADGGALYACSEKLTPEQHEKMVATFGANMGQ